MPEVSSAVYSRKAALVAKPDLTGPLWSSVLQTSQSLFLRSGLNRVANCIRGRLDPTLNELSLSPTSLNTMICGALTSLI